MRQAPPDGYEEKFAGFIRACEKARAEGIPNMIIARPHALGDTHDEIIENLWRLADAQLALLITGP